MGIINLMLGLISEAVVKHTETAILVRPGPHLCLHFSGLGTMVIVICEKKVRELKNKNNLKTCQKY